MRLRHAAVSGSCRCRCSCIAAIVRGVGAKPNLPLPSTPSSRWTGWRGLLPGVLGKGQRCCAAPNVGAVGSHHAGAGGWRAWCGWDRRTAPQAARRRCISTLQPSCRGVVLDGRVPEFEAGYSLREIWSAEVQARRVARTARAGGKGSAADRLRFQCPAFSLAIAGDID